MLSDLNSMFVTSQIYVECQINNPNWHHWPIRKSLSGHKCLLSWLAVFDKPLSMTLTHRHRGLSFSLQYSSPVEMPTGAAASRTWTLHKVNTLATHTHRAASVCFILSASTESPERGRGGFGDHRDVIHTCLQMHTRFIHWSLTYIVVQRLLARKLTYTQCTCEARTPPGC